jgi:hypothetical protein
LPVPTILGMRWTAWYVSEWCVTRLGTVYAGDGLEALELVRFKLAIEWATARDAAPGGTLAALREGVPAPVAREAERGEFFSPKMRYKGKPKFAAGSPRFVDNRT